MKKIGIYTYTALLMIMAAALYSCEPDDNEKEWGNTKVYMPQAAILDGGLSNNYPVPLNNNASTNNYKVDSETNTLKIVLGVYRSGLQELQAFSVDVAADLSATATAVPAVTKGIALPTDVYSLPGKVSVDGGKRESIFYLDVDLNKLINDYPDYNTKQMVLVVAISNPSQYELNTNLAKTTVIIDGASFMPVRKIVQGGDFEAGSEAYWTFLNTNATVLPNTFASITNGA
ncbi:MAG: DUF1735 domain-containing protein, partial [Candidatus Symbiothrix sp.]|nr:DUF1735 domain-containing protein [Candidatus Symbiothrix sp.]